MGKRYICLTITQIRSHVNFGNNFEKPKQKKERFYFDTLKWHRSTCYVNWAILIGDPVDVTTLLLGFAAIEIRHFFSKPLRLNFETCMVFSVPVLNDGPVKT